MIETAVLSFALTAIALPPQYPPKTPAKPAPKVAQVQADPRFTDFAKAVLHCYHPTARFRDATIVQRPWQRKAQDGAKGSAVVSIQYVGISDANYTLVVGVLAKPGAVKTVIRTDTAKVRAWDQCELGEWVAVK
ncbi:MAG: hypothetical protein ABI537_16715 [Casimicrobiaceae bacterium]